MIPFVSWKTVFTLVALAAVIEGRRVRVKPASASNEEPQPQAQSQPPRQVLFYAEEPQQSEEDEVVIARQPHYSRAAPPPNPTFASRARTEAPKAPPIQTLRNYNKINDDGSFTFGYEAADGSFKEETRGTDCVVRGKYGYIDPDGNKREFTYVSGNPCDPNAISQEDEDELKDKGNEDENIPANIPRRPGFVVRPLSKTKPATTLFSQSFNNDDVSRDDGSNHLVEIRPTGRPLVQSTPFDDDAALLRSTIRPVARVTYPSTTRFAAKQSTAENQPATTYRPQTVQFTVAPSPATILPKTTRTPYIPSSTPSPTYFDEQFKKFQLESNVIPSQGPVPKPISSNPVYSTELVYDPSSGQYNTIVYQQVPKFGGSDINLSQRLPFAPSPQPALQPVTVPRFSTTTTPSPFLQQQYIQQQQQAALVQQSQQLYNQQLRAQQQRQYGSQGLPQTTLLKQNPHRYPSPIVQRYPSEFRPQPVAPEAYQQAAPQFYYINPTVDQRQNLAAGQIESFLRGHNLQF